MSYANLCPTTEIKKLK